MAEQGDRAQRPIQRPFLKNLKNVLYVDSPSVASGMKQSCIRFFLNLVTNLSYYPNFRLALPRIGRPARIDLTIFEPAMPYTEPEIALISRQYAPGHPEYEGLLQYCLKNRGMSGLLLPIVVKAEHPESKFLGYTSMDTRSSVAQQALSRLKSLRERADIEILACFLKKDLKPEGLNRFLETHGFVPVDSE